MAALALMVVSAKSPDRHGAGPSAMYREAHAFPVAAIVASARVQAIVLGIAAALVGIGGSGVSGAHVAAPPPDRTIDGNVEPFINAHLRARADGALDHGRPARLP
jgi:hypothetical protein